MLFEEITDNLKHFLKEYSYFHDCIVKKINILNTDIINKKGSVEIKDEGDELEVFIFSQLGFRLRVKLHKVRGLRVLRLSNFIIFEVSVKKEDNNIYFSLTGGFDEKDIYFRCESFEIEEIVPLADEYRLKKK